MDEDEEELNEPGTETGPGAAQQPPTHGQYQPQQKCPTGGPDRDSLIVQDLIGLGETAEFGGGNEGERAEEATNDDVDTEVDQPKEPLYDSVPQESPVDELAEEAKADNTGESATSDTAPTVSAFDSNHEILASTDATPVIPPKSASLLASVSYPKQPGSYDASAPLSPEKAASSLSRIAAPASPKMARPEMPPPPIPAKQNSPRLGARPFPSSAGENTPTPSSPLASSPGAPSKILEKILGGSAVATPLAGIGIPAGAVSQLRSTKTEPEKPPSSIDAPTNVEPAIKETVEAELEEARAVSHSEDQPSPRQSRQAQEVIKAASAASPEAAEDDYAYVVRIQSPARSNSAARGAAGIGSRPDDTVRSSFSSFTSFR